MIVSSNNLIEQIKRAHLPEILTDADLIQLVPETPARRHNLVKRALASGKLLRIRRGLYTLNDLYRDVKIHPFKLAQWIYGPSAISCESALSYWNLIPEAVYTVTSVTRKRSKEFATPFGTYAYTRLPYSPLYLQVERIDDHGSVFFVAKALRALADYVYISGKRWTLSALTEALRVSRIPIGRRTVKQLKGFYRNARVQSFLDSCLEASRAS